MLSEADVKDIANKCESSIVEIVLGADIFAKPGNLRSGMACIIGLIKSMENVIRFRSVAAILACEEIL